MDTVKPMFYERMVSSVSTSFTNLVVVGIKVELGLKNGKMITTPETYHNNVKRFFGVFQRKKEGETNAMSTSQRRIHSWKKQQQQIAQQQPTYPMQYIQQPYVEAITPAFNQSQAHKGLVTPRPLGPPPNPLPSNLLKHIVRELVEKKILSFRDVGPNVKSNPLPTHGDVNASEDVYDVCIIKNVEYVKTLLLALHARLVGASLIDTYHDNCQECALFPRGCKLVGADIQNLMDQGVLQVCGPTTNEEISVIDPFFNLPEPVKITYQTKDVVRPSPVEATTAVPAPEYGGVQSAVQSGKSIEFLKMIKKNDYKIVNQLHQTPSKVSILSLLLNSQAHREALLKVLAQAHVTQDITVGQFDGVVSNIIACNTLSFSNEELPKEGQNHNRALHVSIKCQQDALARVLVNTGSSLNVLPKRALAKSSYQGSEMKPSALVVKAFDGSRRIVVGGGRATNPNQTACINFQVMDINPAYSFLLGRPWIHAVGAVTSSLHQKMKFVVNNKLVIISGEEDFIISDLSSFRYIEADEDALETSFQALEIANVALAEVKDSIKKASLSFASLKSAKSAVESRGPIG
ncbi:uncharacterized protein LOC127080362 [Lathyrus oleraceus]|uniref:uncharacterized protein LOC127080362 n=1 Tax=Pisum sativum TaxID=3888 RepID=UPI0021CFB415|nr:uncharacterized protein LOC127080362 [Pisum sativum]